MSLGYMTIRFKSLIASFVNCGTVIDSSFNATTKLRLSTWRLRRGDVFVEIYISFYFNASHDSKPLPMSIIEDSPLSVETPAISAHDTSTQPNTTHHMGNSVLGVEGIALTRRYVTK